MAKGQKTGGRSKGTPNKATAAKEAAIAASGLTPLDYMLTVMRDESQKLGVRLSAACSAAPYVHPKLANVNLAGQGGGPLEIKIVRYSPTQLVGPSPVPIAGVVGVGAGLPASSGVLAPSKREG